MKLMAYADGELEGIERRDAELLLAREPEAVTFIEQVADLGSILKEGHEDRHANLFASFDIADAVMAATKTVTQDKPDAKADAAADKGASVTSIAEIAAKRAAREAQSGKAGQGRVYKIGGAVIAALALAASIFVVARGHNQETPMASNQPSVQTQGTAAANVANPTFNAENGPGVAIDSAGKSVSVFYLPTANELSTSVVVWVDESGEK